MAPHGDIIKVARHEFVRSFLRKYVPQRLQPKQMELWLSA
jgi:hypothetical protein